MRKLNIERAADNIETMIPNPARIAREDNDGDDKPTTPPSPPRPVVRRSQFMS